MAGTIAGALTATGAGANVAYTGPSSGSVTADGSGNYVTPSVPDGDYTIVPSKNLLFFTPNTPNGGFSAALNEPGGAVVRGANVTGVSFTPIAVAANPTYRFAGTSGSSVPSLSTSSYTSFGGNPIFLICTIGATGIQSISDSCGNNYVLDKDVSGTAGLSVYRVNSSLAAGGGTSNIVTVTFTSSQPFAAFSIWEIGNTFGYALAGGILGFVMGDSKDSASGTSISSNAFNMPGCNFGFIASTSWASSGYNMTSGGGVLSGTLDHTGSTFAAGVGHGEVFGSTSGSVATLNNSGTYNTGHIMTAAWAWFTKAITGNCGVANATINYSGPRSGSVTADINGNYRIPFSAGTDIATWTITPSKTGITFSPSNNTVVVSTLANDVAGPNFTASTTLVSGPTFSAVSDSAIVVRWTTAGGCESKAFATGDIWVNKPAVDNGIPADETDHYAVIAGLKPSTLYAVNVQSLNLAPAAQNITTGPRTARFLLSGLSYGSVTDGLHNGGDTFFNFKSNDGAYYCGQDDGGGLNVGTQGNVVISKMTNPTTVTGTLINSMLGLGAVNTYDGQDSPINAGSTRKYGGGLFGMAGNLFACILRQAAPAENYALYRGTVLKSTDKGVTWSEARTPNVAVAAAYEPKPVFQYIYGDETYGWVSPISYDADDGTLGYATAANLADGGNAYVYQTIGPVQISPGSTSSSTYAYLMRTPRRAFNQLLIGPGYSQYWAGPLPGVVTPQDFVNDSNWISSAAPAGLTKIFDVTGVPGGGALWWHKVNFVSRLNSYVVFLFNGVSVMVAPTPAGPWTAFAATGAPSAVSYQGFSLLHGDAASNTAAQNIAMRMMFNSVFSGNNGAATAMGTFTTSAYPISGNVGVGGATVNWTGPGGPGSVVADAQGYYIIPNLANGAYTVTPVLAGYAFRPATANPVVNNADITSLNFSIGGSAVLGDDIGAIFQAVGTVTTLTASLQVSLDGGTTWSEYIAAANFISNTTQMQSIHPLIAGARYRVHITSASGSMDIWLASGGNVAKLNGSAPITAPTDIPFAVAAVGKVVR